MAEEITPVCADYLERRGFKPMTIAAVARSQVDPRLVFARPLPVASAEDLLFAGPPLDIGKRKDPRRRLSLQSVAERSLRLVERGKQASRCRHPE
jgi:hypothetical protein